jgi:hypothetical protein
MFELFAIRVLNGLVAAMVIRYASGKYALPHGRATAPSRMMYSLTVAILPRSRMTRSLTVALLPRKHHPIG